MLDIGARVEIELGVVVGREDFHSRTAAVGIEADRALVRIGNGHAVRVENRLPRHRVEQDVRVRRVGIAIRIMCQVSQVAVDVARLEVEPGALSETVLEQRGALQQTPIVAVPAGLADEQVVRKRAIWVGQDRADER